MIAVANKPGRFFIPESDASGRDASSMPSDGLASYSTEELFADPAVCRRVGQIISKGAAGRRPERRPAQRTGRPGGSTD
jgi:hypothetical protein